MFAKITAPSAQSSRGIVLVATLILSKMYSLILFGNQNQLRNG